MINRTSSFFLTLMLLLLSLTVGAETIEGVVVDTRSHEPLVGVSVGVKQARKLTGGVTTDINGRFKVNTDAEFPLTLEFHYVGYQTTSVLVYDASEEITVTLTEQQNRLANVVVVGYGTQKRENLTSSISSVGGRVVNELNNASVENALAGQASGISLTVPNGTLGQAPIVRVRGVASITSGTQPLYVVDGVVIANDDYSNMGISNPLATINANDIESIDVLKDASAAALYGSRAANGVVLITTKSGKKGKPQINYQGSVSVSYPKDYLDLCNAQEYVNLENEAVYNRYGNYSIGTYDVLKGDLGGYHIKGEPKAFNVLYDDDGNVVETNWQKYVTRTAWSHNHTFSVGGATNDVDYYFSGNWQDLEGTIIGNKQTRLQFNANVTAKVNSWLKIGGRTTLTETNLRDYDPISNKYYEGNGQGFYWRSINIPANIPAYNADGTAWVQGGRVGYGPNQASVAMDTPSIGYETDSKATRRNSHRFYNFFAEITPLKGLTYRSQYGRDITDVEDRAYYARETAMFKYNGYAANIATNIDQYTWTNTLTYSKDFESGHHFDALVGVEAFEKQHVAWGSKRYNQAEGEPAVYEAAFNDIASLVATRREIGMLSYLWRVNYDWKSRYILSINFRRDGLSSLSKNNRWGNFGGASAAWKISDEKFYEPLKKVFDDVKLRASWGVVGNTSIGAYASSSTYSSGYNGNTATYNRSQVADKDLKWEQSTKFDVGFSGRLLNRVDVDFGFYNIKGTDLILSVPTAPSRGVTNNNITSNVGSMYNRGFEISIGADVVRGKKFSWNTNFNISFNKNKVTSLGGAESIISTYNITQVGKSIGQLYLYRSSGIDRETGRRIVYDKSGKEVLIVFQNGETTYQHRDGSMVNTSDLDRHAAGNTIPTYYGGWSNQFRYKYWDLAINFQFSGGNKIWNGNKGLLAQYGFRNDTKDVYYNHWSPTNKDAEYAIPMYGDNISNGNGGLPLDFLVEKGDYIRLKTLTLGYNIERKAWLKAVKISAIRVYLQATNLLTITDYSGLDPEVSYTTSAASNAYNLQAGIDNFSLPQTQTFTLGVNVKF